MTILFSCPHCAKTAKLPKHFVGKTVKCKCGQKVVVDAPPNPMLELGDIQYEVVDETAPLGHSKSSTNPIGRVRKKKMRKEDKVLSKKLGRNWRSRPHSEYRAGTIGHNTSWVKDVKNVVTQGPVQAFWAAVFGVLLLCFGIHMLSWGGAEIGISESVGYLSQVLVRFSAFFMVFGAFVAFCGFTILLNALFRGEIRNQFDSKTVFSLISGTCVLFFVLVGFTTWILLRNVGLGATSIDNFGASLGAGETNLVKRVAAPQAWEKESTPDDPNISLVTYPSGDLSLKAHLWMPEKVKGNHPVLIYLHPGHAIEKTTLKDVEHFHKNEFIVMAPSFRGENGNPGYFELMFGEVDDAVAATKWIAKQEHVDATRIYVFGYGVGGGISSLMSLRKDSHAQTTASCGGLYPNSVFAAWPDGVPFNVHNSWECRSRVLLGRISEMQREHVAYIGNGDTAFSQVTDIARKETSMLNGPRLSVRPIEGDHKTSLRNAVRAFETTIYKKQ